MKSVDSFLSILEDHFPDDRLTYQKAVPTFHPESADEAADLFRLANKHGQRIFITGFGNNIDPQGKPFTELVAVRTDRLNNVIEFAEEDFYITTGAGFPLREVNEYVRKQDRSLTLPHSLLPYVGSVGGAVAVGLSSDLSGHDFPIKKYLLKAEVVTPEGEVITPGSACFKSVSGYDIVKIFAGSWGLLGLIVNATFRLVPEALMQDFSEMKMKPINRKQFLSAIDASNTAAEAEYSRKIRARFDPNQILPAV